MIGLEKLHRHKTNLHVYLQASCLPGMSHSTALRRLGLLRHNTGFATLSHSLRLRIDQKMQNFHSMHLSLERSAPSAFGIIDN